ncbi:MAG: class II aldolase/adducin family protein [Streptosporangiaceae bacterium]
MSDIEDDLRHRLARVHRILTAGGIWPLTKGHVSARVPGAKQILVLSHIHARGRTLDTTTPDDICTVGYDGTQLAGTIDPVGELYMHTAILSQRSDLHSVVHCHSTYATALGVAGVKILPVGRRGAPFYPQVPILDFDGQIDSAAKGQRLVDVLSDGCAVVLKNHGTVVAADTIENATMLAFALEDTARLQYLASGVGTPQGMSEAEARSTMSGHRRDEYFNHVWQHYAVMDPRPGDPPPR